MHDDKNEFLQNIILYYFKTHYLLTSFSQQQRKQSVNYVISYRTIVNIVNRLAYTYNPIIYASRTQYIKYGAYDKMI